MYVYIYMYINHDLTILFKQAVMTNGVRDIGI